MVKKAVSWGAIITILWGGMKDILDLHSYAIH
jgi:hypothetical protein